MKKKYKIILIYLFDFFLLAGLLITSYFIIINNWNIEKWEVVITVLSLGLLLYHLTRFNFKKVTITDFRLWLIILINIFMFGRIYLEAFTVNNKVFWDLLNRYPDNLLYIASFYAICSLQALFIGMNFERKPVDNTLVKPKIDNKQVYKVGIFLLLIATPFKIYIDIISIIQTQSKGSYSALTSSTGFMDDLAVLFIPAIVYIISSKVLAKPKNLMFIIIVISYLTVLMILTGDRRYSVTAILALTFCYITLYNIKVPKLKLILYGIISALFLNLLSIIRNIRLDNLTDLASFFSLYWNNLFVNNPLYETLAEFGLSFISLVGVIKNIPSDIDYQYGFSFWGSIPSSLPIGWLFGDFFEKVSISRAINEIEGYPVGATIIGDFYANFGWFSIIFLILFGYFLNFIFQREFNNAQNTARYFALFYLLINIPRSSFFELFRPTLMILILPSIIILLTKSNKIKKGVSYGEKREIN